MLALRYDASEAAVDLVDAADHEGIESELVVAILSDARVDPSEVPPGTPLRGYWADSFDPSGEQLGSRLWLLEQAAATPANARRAEQYLRDATAYLLRDKRARAIDVAAELEGERIVASVTVTLRSGRLLSLGPFEVTHAS